MASDWERLRPDEQFAASFSAAERIELESAIGFFGETLGTDFITTMGRGHPLAQFIFNAAPWTRKWFLQFHRDVQLVAQAEGSQELLQRLRSVDTASEALSILEATTFFLRAGFSVRIIAWEPSIARAADFLARDPQTDDELAVEVTTLSTSRGAREASEKFERITMKPFIAGLQSCGHLEIVPSDSRMKDLENQVDQAIARAKTYGGLQEIRLPGVLRMAVARDEQAALMDEWARQNELDPKQFVGPPMEDDLGRRLQERLVEKATQVERHPASLVWVRTHSLFLDRRLRRLSVDLAEFIHRFGHLVGLVLHWHLIGGPSEVPAGSAGQAYSRAIAGIFHETWLVIENEYCNRKLAPATLTRIHRAGIISGKDVP